ncbi:transcriptional regulator [Polaribacter reichenbachii]|uniref:ArsR family transcriptional regulator n=1 Tax=Polaribacter reichenbachii TaxID=996801 RepID=A0A1B8U4T7_9FLAO|nr:MULTISPECIES: metalloregulator ArsR/SmtB family transcription factor [Polaribacter]APZ44872.1 transcriptional regulator [Polaribacter reichenbachii]AUC18736.1 transcriptional regulator [Polaribacter reichenbachii]MBU3012802.1 metalloregulator ArsR/SmtB family transcription factor [Polaribacter vadi]MDO6742618.1 metalloregulator ArsR/SmtB family transcription factor [Polaribacter sp. 1_MG-2023]OBY66849.1 ArsR family transcriptional regulator [Polaribacter reichenbachii]
MGLTKSEIFTDEQNEIAAIAKVLGHPARIAILDYIIKLKSCVCGDLVKEIGLAQPTISQHLKELKKVGILKGTIEGTSVCYCIDDENWKEINNKLSKFLSKNPTESCC